MVCKSYSRKRYPLLKKIFIFKTILKNSFKLRAIKNIYFQELFFLLVIENKYKIKNALRSALVI